MIRALVLWANEQSTNLGVRALAEGTAALAQRVWPGVELTYVSYGPSAAPMRIGRAQALLREAVTGKNGLRAFIRQFDVVLDTRAGDSFSDIYGLSRMAAGLMMTELATRSGVPVVMTPQTIGPFNSWRSEKIAKRNLRRAAAVLARDSTSFSYARQLGREAHLTTDVVFALPGPQTSGVSRDIVLNVSGLLWQPNPHVDHLGYRQEMAQLAQALVESGRQVCLLAHVLESPDPDSDLVGVRGLANQLQASSQSLDLEVIVPTSLAELREVVATARLVYGARMHACLNALSVGTPAVALAYSRKFGPLLSDLGWDATVSLQQKLGDGAVARAAAAFSERPELADQATEVRSRADELLKVAESVLATVIS